MRLRAAFILLAAAPLHAMALSTANLVAHDAASLELLARNCIVVTTTGRLDLAYAGASRALAAPDLLGDVQREYAKQLPAGKKPEFVVEQTEPGLYAYVNRKGQPSLIREVHRAEHEGPCTEVVLFVSARRFFGSFRSLIHVAISPTSDNELRYVATVYAFPEVGLSRFFARHLGIVERYFHRKTKHIEAITTRIGAALCAPREEVISNL